MQASSRNEREHSIDILVNAGRLEAWPATSGAKPLRRELAGRYRIRTGDWRVVFRVSGDEVLVERIAHRSDVYDP